MKRYNVGGKMLVHIDDAGVTPQVGLAVRIGSTGVAWADFESHDGTVKHVGPKGVTVDVPGVGLYLTSGYNLYVQPKRA